MESDVKITHMSTKCMELETFSVSLRYRSRINNTIAKDFLALDVYFWRSNYFFLINYIINNNWHAY